ncbi:MAG: transglutaminase family protein [Pseudomonadota bacterium]
MRLKIAHETTYGFAPPMRGVVQSHRLTPSVFEGQSVINWSVAIDDAERGASFRDGAGDWIDTFTVMGPVENLVVLVTGEVETVDLGGVLRGHREKMVPTAYLRPTHATKPDRKIAELAADTVADIPAADALARAHALCQAVAGAITYTPGQTGSGTRAAEALALGRGVCQDHAHTIIACALTLDMPARYVTGYLFSSEEEGMHEASHAWAEVFVPDLGWVGFDASNGVCPDERYVRIGSGADAEEAAPIRGVAQGVGVEELDARVRVDQVAQ